MLPPPLADNKRGILTDPPPLSEGEEGGLTGGGPKERVIYKYKFPTPTDPPFSHSGSGTPLSNNSSVVIHPGIL